MATRQIPGGPFLNGAAQRQIPGAAFLNESSGGAGATIGQAVETDSAQPFSVNSVFQIGQANETDLAQLFSIDSVFQIGQVNETDIALALIPYGTLTLLNIHVKTLGVLIGQSGQAGTFRVFADADLTDDIATKTGTIDGGNDVALTDAAFTPGTWYLVAGLLANNNRFIARVQAA